jgi:predicted PurR-regulated permease PerM
VQAEPKRPLARHPFFGLATLVLVVVILSKAQAVLVPLALSVLIAFALTPSVRSLSRRLGHGLAVALVVIVAVGAVASFAYFLERQLVELSTQMSRYSEAMTSKLAVLRGTDSGGLSGISKTVDKLAAELDHGPATSSEVAPLQVVPAKAGALERFNQTIAPVLKPAADGVVVIVLVIFLLVRRGDVRDRIIRLAGKRHVSLTTRALDEAGQRIGRFLLIQSAINGAFGIAVSLALWLIGVPFPPVWGFLAAVLRFVPFLGTILGMVLPAALAFAQLPGWSHTLAVIGVFLGLDVVVAYFVEPLVVGHRTGVSSLAMIVMAVFWTWLWGPVGLVLSTPLTVCLAVLGRQVPAVEFLAVLLGDEPPLDPDVLFYQRLLAGDEDEATNLIEAQLRAGALEAFDGLMLPALRLAERDRARGEISDAEYDQVVAMMTGLATGAGGEATGRHGGPRATHRVLGLPGPSSADQLAWHLLTQVVDPAKVTMETVSDALVSEVVPRLETAPPDLVVVTALGPGGARHARQLGARLLRAQPGLRIAVLRPEVGGTAPTNDGAPPSMTTVRSLREAQERVAQVLLLAPAETPAAPAPVVDLVR